MGRRALHVRFLFCFGPSVLLNSNRADYVDDECIQELLAWRHPYSIESDFQYTEEENMTMLRLPRKECELILLLGPNAPTQSSISDLVTISQTHDLYLTLVTLLFSYAYDARSTQHDPSTESAWTISSLTPGFSALDPPPYHSEKDVTAATTY
jgi:protein SHQ1